MGQQFVSLLQSFVFGISTVLSDGCQVGIAQLSSMTFSNINLKVVVAGFSFFYQKVWMPQIRGAPKFFLLLISVLRFSSVILNHFTLLTISSNYSCTLSIDDIAVVLLSFFQIHPQISTSLSISGICPSCSLPPSTFLKKYL